MDEDWALDHWGCWIFPRDGRLLSGYFGRSSFFRCWKVVLLYLGKRSKISISVGIKTIGFSFCFGYFIFYCTQNEVKRGLINLKQFIQAITTYQILQMALESFYAVVVHIGRLSSRYQYRPVLRK
jgi:hypothetical protein